MKLATDLGGGAAETEKVGELQPDGPKTNRRASRATYVFRQSPLSRAPRPFVGPVLKGRNGSIDPFGKPSATGRYLREADGRSRREPDIAHAGSNVTIGREVRLQASPREGPESAP